jgi:hypothetical protein
MTEKARMQYRISDAAADVDEVLEIGGKLKELRDVLNSYYRGRVECEVSLNKKKPVFDVSIVNKMESEKAMFGHAVSFGSAVMHFISKAGRPLFVQDGSEYSTVEHAISYYFGKGLERPSIFSGKNLFGRYVVDRPVTS